MAVSGCDRSSSALSCTESLPGPFLRPMNCSAMSTTQATVPAHTNAWLPGAVTRQGASGRTRRAETTAPSTTVLSMSESTAQESARVLLSTDPECQELEARGWQVLSESWGARLRPTEEDLPRLAHLVNRARAHGYAVRELGPDDAAAVADLDAATRGDYPQAGPATAHAPVDEGQAAAALETGRAFGAVDPDGALVAVSVTRSDADRVETDFTAVHPEHRRAGLGTAVKAASVLAWWEDGARVFGTGGAQTNPASLAINRAVGYTVTERWLTYVPGEATSRA